jgi:hypothetical protein
MMLDADAAALSPWDEFDFDVHYYGLLLLLTAVLVVANAVFLTAVAADGSVWVRLKAGLWQVLLAASGLGIGAGLPYGPHVLFRLGALVHRSGH